MLQPRQIPTTGRKVGFQVKQLGFTSAKGFASSLPKDAVIADVGAGLSRLGHEVAALRPDITWVNIDPGYKDKGILATASQNLPSNVILLDANIVEGFKKLPKPLEHKADLVYSYWLLPHLSLENDQTARKACGHMFELLKPNGRLVVGPVRHWGLGLLSPFRYKGNAIHSAQDNKDTVISETINQTRLWWLARMVQLFSNKYGIHVGAKFVGGKIKSD